MSASLFVQKKDWINTFEPALLLVADLYQAENYPLFPQSAFLIYYSLLAP